MASGWAVLARGLCATGALGVAGCNGPTASVAPQDDAVSKRIGNLLAFNSMNAPAGKAAAPAGPRVDCPLVQVESGASSVRVAAGDAANSVRYQISIGDVARECAVAGDKLSIRVGAEINTLLGPAGSPGSYTAPLRVAVRRQSDEAILASKVYRVGGAVQGAGAAQSTLIADPLVVPYVNEHAADDYEVVLSFGEGPTPRRARR